MSIEIDPNIVKATEYLEHLDQISAAAEAENQDMQEYVNSHPEVMPIVGEQDQTEQAWLKDENDLGIVLILDEDDTKWQFEDVTYAMAKEEFEKYENALALKWIPYWAILAFNMFNDDCECEGGCGGDCHCEDDSPGCGSGGCKR
jgi:hypothetical protein